MQYFCYLRLLIFGDTPFGTLLLQKVHNKIVIVHILFILVNTRFLTLLSLGLVTDILIYGSIKDRLLAVSRFRLLGLTSVTFQTTSPFLFAAPFNMSEMVGGCFLVGLLLFTLSVHFWCKDNALLHKLYRFGT